ncbi:hypothetical protein TFLX_04006 [Thermoflexales bacterium]|nr:hypothetical protein TFLX_04006 [Thermoflexales bacterium]
MSMGLYLALRIKDLERRSATLPEEIDYWLTRASEHEILEKNASQLEALDLFMGRLIERTGQAMASLKACRDTKMCLELAVTVVDYLYKTHSIWDFFRDKLETRLVPAFQSALLMSDLIAHDCYTSIINRAHLLQLDPPSGFRQYPLVYLNAETSPATWVRGSRPEEIRRFEDSRLPIPVIEIPWDYTATPWNLLFISHEVAHDLDVDLNSLSASIAMNLASSLEHRGVPAQRIQCWEAWTAEILADLLAVLLSGPAYSCALANQLLLPRDMTVEIDRKLAHPAPAVRLYLNTAFVRTLGQSGDVFDKSAKALEDRWGEVYGEPSSQINLFLDDLTDVVSAVADTPLRSVGAPDRMPCLRDLAIYSANDHVYVQDLAASLASGLPIETVPLLSLRHIVAASFYAFEQVMAIRAEDMDEQLQRLAKTSSELILRQAPPGQLPARIASDRVRAYLVALADEFLDSI